MFQLSDYAFDLPEDKIAQTPCQNRSESRLLNLHREAAEISHHRFKDLTSLLKNGDLLVINDTRVVPARLFGKKQTGGRIEIFIINYAQGMKNLEKTGFFKCDCLIKASKSPEKHDLLFLADSVEASIEAKKEHIFEIKFLNGHEFPQFLEKHGQVPLPPYIKREGSKVFESDKEDYQTVYALNKGAVAAPTAGLHFTESLMDKLEKKGIEFAQITLHVGYGTFVPVKVDDIRGHKMHSEFFSISSENADKINTARKQNRRVVAVGTTCVRTLEFLSDENGMVRPASGMCDLFIYPGHNFKCVNAMITNFHLPGSTLLMLVSAFCTREMIFQAYQQAKQMDYRFFSYGDAMLIQ